LTREDEVRQARNAAEEKLVEAKELEKQWQSKQAEMDQALKVVSRCQFLTPAILAASVVLETRDVSYRI
jgi:hypothetical protein